MPQIKMTGLGPRRTVHVTLPESGDRYILMHPTEGEIELPAGTCAIELPLKASLQVVVKDGTGEGELWRRP